MISERMSATNDRIIIRTHADKVSYVPWCCFSISRGPNDSWDLHIKSITVCMSLHWYSSQTIVAYDIRENDGNDSYDLQSNSFRYSVVCTLLWGLILPLCASGEAPYQVYHRVYECKLRFKPNYSRIWYQRACLQRFLGVSYMSWCCLSRGPNESWDRHIKSITVCMSLHWCSSQTRVAYDIREDVCNDS